MSAVRTSDRPSHGRGLRVARAFGAAALLLCFFSAHAPGLAQETGRVEAVVRDARGAPLAGATASLFAVPGRRLVARAAAGEDGRFRFPSVPAGGYRLVVEAPDRLPADRALDVRAGAVVRVAFELRSEPVAVEPLRVQAASPRTAASSSAFADRELSVRRPDAPGELLRIVPGLSIVQHAGGGKADQYLIRGFDADHGTDLALFFDGIPVNMVSHAHGQGYADLHFLIPETLESVEVYKGPYFAEYGNLATAGAVQLRLREAFETPFLEVSGGSFRTLRALAGWSPEASEPVRVRGFVAGEAYRTDGPFLDPQNLHRLNLATRWTVPVGDAHRVTLFATGYDGGWDASGQIPLREVMAGRLDRFGAVDPTEGGSSSRYNLSLGHATHWEHGGLASQAYLATYRLDLFSNFTFFKEDPENGDGILQTDDRTLFGGHLELDRRHAVAGRPGRLIVGVDYRQDDATVGLFRQRAREVIGTAVHSDLMERNAGLYLEEEVAPAPWLRTILGVRYDLFGYRVRDRTGDGPSGRESRSILLPKASLVVAPPGGSGLELFLNYGRGFHGNDARVVVAEPGATALAAADGYEVAVLKRWRDVEVAFAYWLLDLEGELVWVGDEGTTELSGPTRRHGPELTVSWEPTPGLALSGEVARPVAFFRDGGDPVPRAPRLSYSGTLAWRTDSGPTGSLRLRGVGDFPIDDEGVVRGDGHLLVDVDVAWPLTSGLGLGVSIDNLFDAEAKEAQTFFESRLPGERRAVADNHFTPARPFTLRLGLRATFGG